MLWFRGALPQEVAFPSHFVCKAGCSPNFFEHLVVNLPVKMGYAGTRKDARRAVGKSGDEGIDGILMKTVWGWRWFTNWRNDGKT
jgi:hypothetical protein